jgi:uncharacterized protein (TIGR00369 family)
VTDEEIVQRINDHLQPAIVTLGGRMVAADQKAGSVSMEFDVGAPFSHTGGLTIQGGYIATMLDATMAMAVVGLSRFTRSAPTLELKVSYFLPAKPGRFLSTARLVRMGRSVTFTEADLLDAEDNLVARASSTIAARERKQ